MDTAKKAAIPGSIIGAVLTAITAMYQANDQTLEKKTYEVLSKSMVETQAETRALSARMAVFEQALIMSALNHKPDPAPAPVYVQAPVAPVAPAHHRRAGSSGSSRPPESAAAMVEELVAEAPETEAQLVANLLGRELVEEQGDVHLAPLQTEAPKRTKLPEWNALAE